MKVLALNATYRPDGTTTRLTEKALEGAASRGAGTEMIMLVDHDIQYCTNCLTCYSDLGAEIAPCVINDDVRQILERIDRADAVIVASPVHCGFVTALMHAFVERATFTLCRPTGELAGLKGCPEPRLTGKVRASATIVSAGGVPPDMRQFCDMGTPFLKDFAEMAFNGQVVGDMYAAALFPRQLSDEEYSRAFFHRELTEDQFKEAFDLGGKLVDALKEGRVRPYDPSRITEAITGASGS